MPASRLGAQVFCAHVLRTGAEAAVVCVGANCCRVCCCAAAGHGNGARAGSHSAGAVAYGGSIQQGAAAVLC
jgi:hypothetical protein